MNRIVCNFSQGYEICQKYSRSIIRGTHYAFQKAKSSFSKFVYKNNLFFTANKEKKN